MFWPKGRWLSVRYRLRCRGLDQIIRWSHCASPAFCRLRPLGKEASPAELTDRPMKRWAPS